MLALLATEVAVRFIPVQTGKSIVAKSESANRASAKWRAKNPGYSKEWVRRNPEKRLAATAKHREKNRNRERPSPDSLKLCCGCDRSLPITAFTPSDIRYDGCHPICRVCVVSRSHGITAAVFEAIWAKANNSCGICFRPLVRNKKNGFAIDHDHKTNAIRGLLCNNCNLAIGHFADNAEHCARAAKYLEGNSPC